MSLDDHSSVRPRDRRSHEADDAAVATSPTDPEALGTLPPDSNRPAACPLLWWHPGVLLATGLGVGYAPVAPGTFGTIWGLPLAWGLSRLPLPIAAIVWGISLGLGYWACRCGARHFQSHDPGGIVVDEYLAVPLAAAPLWFGAPPLATLLAAFVVFRVFDIWKPGPVGWCDRRGGPLGVLLDDLAAAGLTAGLLFAAFSWLPSS